MKMLNFTNKMVILTMIIVAIFFVFDSKYGLEAEEYFANFRGRIVKIVGDAKIRRAGGKEWITAKHGMELDVEDQIITGVESNIDIMFNRGGQRSKVRVLENADMSLVTLNLDKVTGDSEILLDLAIGHIIIKTDPLKGKSRFEVLTPISMTAVRGTAFEVNVTREESPIDNADIVQ